MFQTEITLTFELITLNVWEVEVLYLSQLSQPNIITKQIPWDAKSCYKFAFFFRVPKECTGMVVVCIRNCIQITPNYVADMLFKVLVN